MIHQTEPCSLKHTEPPKPIVRSTVDYSLAIQILKWFHLVQLEFKRMVLNPAFIVITVMAMVNIAFNFYGNVGPFDNNSYPIKILKRNNQNFC